MKISKIISIITIMAGFTLISCESVEQAQKVADEFYTAYNTEDEAKMESLFDKELIIDAGIAEDFYNVFNQRWQTFGKATSHKKYAFSTNTNNGQTIVTLKYEVENEKGDATLYEKLDFIKRGENFNIIAYEYNIDKSAIDNSK
jgi:hypothetical protein